ncbi:winged helix-turn-helix domain-containing protein [Catellatospora tritici]|uniref:winged helix-turn-helix domain-containing protein n=1 Tax=Catellatospora tritici TaxID=2851566 RepID=UPI001C2D2E75|nr:GntR family transcriptional regulator [Catellatospora tritici]MBV1851891.1 GntR family transcriptional regulator [Catellatospora tritici]
MSSQLEALGQLDPDDERPPFQQVANVLRAAIRTGVFGPGERLPTQSDLADRFGVARETVKSALRVLRDERLIVSRQGSGAFVRAQTERPVGLRPHVEDLFGRDRVTLDFAGFGAETLHGVLAEPLDKIRAGQLTPKSLVIRILLPDMQQPAALPSLAGGGDDDPRVRERMHRIVRRHTEAITDTVSELADLGLLQGARAEVRVHRAGPLFKLYILNREEAFFGFYPVAEHTVSIKGEPVAIFDAMGKDATLLHFVPTDDPTATDPRFIEQAQLWFDSVWDTIAYEVHE